MYIHSNQVMISKTMMLIYVKKYVCPVFGIRLVKSLRSKVSTIDAKNSNNNKISTYAKISIRVGVLMLKYSKNHGIKYQALKVKPLKERNPINQAAFSKSVLKKAISRMMYSIPFHLFRL